MSARRRRAKTSSQTGGRPTKFRAEFVDVAAALAKNGASDMDVAYALDVSIWTVRRWQSQHEDFCRALVVPPGAPDDRVERSLFQRALGFEMQEAHPVKLREVQYQDGKKVAETERVEIVDVTRMLPPETNAAMKWLTNRRPDKWRDRHEYTGAGGKDLIPDYANHRDLARAVLDILRAANVEGAAASNEAPPSPDEDDVDYGPDGDDQSYDDQTSHRITETPETAKQGGKADAAQEAPRRLRKFNPVTGRLE